MSSSRTHPGILRDGGDTAGTLRHTARNAQLPALPCPSPPSVAGAEAARCFRRLPVAPGLLRASVRGRSGGVGSVGLAAQGAASFFSLWGGELASCVPGLGPALPCPARRGSGDGGTAVSEGPGTAARRKARVFRGARTEARRCELSCVCVCARCTSSVEENNSFACGLSSNHCYKAQAKKLVFLLQRLQEDSHLACCKFQGRQRKRR